MKSEQSGARLWVDGSVYSPADPFATAVLMDGPTIAWVGSDDAARGIAGPHVAPGDLRAAVVTPAFVAHHVLGSASGTLPRARHGYGAVELLGADPEQLRAAVTEVREQGMHALPVLVRDTPLRGDTDADALPSPSVGLRVGADTPVAAVREHLVACTRAGLQAVLVLDEPADDALGTAQHHGHAALQARAASPGDGAPSGGTGTRGPGAQDAAQRGDATASDPLVDVVLEAAEAAREETGERTLRARTHRIVGVGDLDEAQCARLVALSCTVSCRAGRAPLRELARAGVPVSLMTDEENPWNAVRAALDAPQERLRTSARAAFLALTRGAWRVHPGGPPLAGQLVPGAEATLAVWDAESVMVQQAQGTGASWSTDPRARTPVLPALDDARLPRCEATVVAGRLVAGEEPRP